MILFRLLLITVFSLCLINSSFAYEYYEAGKKAFQEQNYEKASQYLHQAVKNHPGHLKCRYYYAQALVHLRKFDQAQKQFQKIIEISPQSYEARLASIGISEIEKYVLVEKGVEIDAISSSYNESKVYFKSGDNYIENALDAGMVTRWHSDKMPIKLYIERAAGVSGYRDEYYTQVKRAMDEWVHGAGKNLISYDIVDKPDDADIRVYFVNEILKKTGKGYITGLATPHTRGNILKHYEIKFVPNESLYTTALHEFGHALGIRGHSSDKSDIMYASVNNVQGLSQRDKNTLALLYTLYPDVSNFDSEDEIVKDSEKNIKVLGPKDALLEKKLREAVDYTKQYPNNVLSWVHLGKAYYDQEKYELAKVSFEKAIEIDPTFTNAIESLAFTHKKLNENDEAGALFEKLAKMESDNIAFVNNYAYFLIENNRNEEAEEVLSKLLRLNPKASEDESIKQLMDYLESVNQ